MLQLLDNPLSNAQLFEIFVAAKNKLHAQDDILNVLLGSNLGSLTPTQKELLIQLAPRRAAAVESILAASIDKRLIISDDELVKLAYATMQNPDPSDATAISASFKGDDNDKK